MGFWSQLDANQCQTPCMLAGDLGLTLIGIQLGPETHAVRSNQARLHARRAGIHAVDNEADDDLDTTVAGCAQTPRQDSEAANSPVRDRARAAVARVSCRALSCGAVLRPTRERPQ